MSTRMLLKKSTVVLLIFLAISASGAEKIIDSMNGVVRAANPAIVKDEIIIPMENGTVMEWRHIVLKGNNSEIGAALGEIAQNDYGVTSLKKYADPIYGKARQEYMARNYPIMRERMKGIATSYGLSQDNATFDTTALLYDAGSQACSMVYFPPKTTLNGHAITSRNMDWSLVPMDVYLGKTENGTGRSMFARNFLIEIYPDHGYSTMAIAGLELNSVIDGLNSEGLGISLLEDEGMDPVPETSIAGERNSGIMSTQITRLVLETCRTVEDAKVAFLDNKEFLPMVGVHYMVYDSQGNSAIIEWNRTDGNLYFTDGSSSKPNIMTNHPLFKFSGHESTDLAREENMISHNDSYDTFNRYITLYNITSSHQGKFSDEEAGDILSAVNANTILEAEGATTPLPITTIWNVILDLTDRSLKMKFFLKKGPMDKATNESTLIFTPYLAFKMNNSSMQ
jgi:predicted choloylglycine hydrolase